MSYRERLGGTSWLVLPSALKPWEMSFWGTRVLLELTRRTQSQLLYYKSPKPGNAHVSIPTHLGEAGEQGDLLFVVAVLFYFTDQRNWPTKGLNPCLTSPWTKSVIEPFRKFMHGEGLWYEALRGTRIQVQSIVCRRNTHSSGPPWRVVASNAFWASGDVEGKSQCMMKGHQIH